MDTFDRLLIIGCFIVLFIAIVTGNLRLETQIDDTTYRVHQKYFKTMMPCMECHDNTKPKEKH